MGYLKYVVLITQVGLSIAVPIIGSIWLGAKIDEYLQTHGLVVMLFVLIGVGTGLTSAYRLVMRVFDKKE